MELLLKKNIDKLGRVGDVVNVKKGYARNYLLPKGLATYITPENLRLLEKEKKRMEQQLKEEWEKLQEILEKISSVSCTISAKANEEGKLFGSITSAHIAERMEKEGISITKDMVKLDNPIKMCGEFDVTIALSGEMQTTCKIFVVKEDTENT